MSESADDPQRRGAAEGTSLDLRAVLHVAKLARLRLDEAEAQRYRDQLASILGHISKLAAVDVRDVEPLAQPFASANRLAADEPSEPMPLEDLLRNAPATEGRFLSVPKVLGDGGGA